MCTPSTHQSSITLPSMLSYEDEKQSVRRVCKNVSVTLLQSFAVLPEKEEMTPLTGRADLCYVDGWGALIGEHCVERCLDVCTPSTYQSSITLPSMLSYEDEKQSVRRVCKNVSVRTLLQSFAVLPGKE